MAPLIPLPEIVTEFDGKGDDTVQPLYHAVLQRHLGKLICSHFPQAIREGQLDYKALGHALYPELPFFTHLNHDGAPNTFSFYLLNQYRGNAFKFFVDMISNWLVPGHRLDIALLHAVDFKIPRMDDEKYTFVKVMLNIQSEFELEAMLKNLAILETEIRLGISSPYFARRIIESKAVSADQTTAFIQEHLLRVLKRHPTHFDHDLFSEMHHLLVMCSDAFRQERSSVVLARIIALSYLFRHAIQKSLQEAPDRRHLLVKLFKIKSALGVLVAINFFSDKEILEERHLLKAIQNYLPGVEIVPGSFILCRRAIDRVGVLYLELTQSDGTDFTMDEMVRLREVLSIDLKDRVEHMMHPVFMPRNEEEIMKNILHLSDQIKYSNDMPQVFITFDEQTYSHLYFTIIHVHVVMANEEKMEDLFRAADTFLEYLNDFSKTVGTIRKKYPKEATVFRVKLPKDMFLRDDHSIDLYKARQVVASELERIAGEFRDFNGGMITKQNEQLCDLRSKLADEGVYSDLLLENFFYSLRPASLRSIFDVESLKRLFLLLLDTVEAMKQFSIQRELDEVCVVLRVKQKTVKKEIDKALDALGLLPGELGSAFVTHADTSYLGYIFRSSDPYKQEHFCQTIHLLLKEEE